MTTDQKTSKATNGTDLDFDAIINSITADFKKAKGESFKAKAKAIMDERDEAAKTARLAEVKLEKLMADFRAGLV